MQGLFYTNVRDYVTTELSNRNQYVKKEQIFYTINHLSVIFAAKRFVKGLTTCKQR